MEAELRVEVDRGVAGIGTVGREGGHLRVVPAEVHPRAEAAAAPGDHDDADRVVELREREHLDEVTAHAEGHGVQPFGSRESDDRDAVRRNFDAESLIGALDHARHLVHSFASVPVAVETPMR